MAQKKKVPVVPSSVLSPVVVQVRIRAIQNGGEEFAIERIHSLRKDIQNSEIPERERHLLAIGVLEHSILGKRPRKLIQKTKLASEPKDRRFFLAQAAKCFQDYLGFCQRNPEIIKTVPNDHEEFTASESEIVKLAQDLEELPSPTVQEDSAAAE